MAAHIAILTKWHRASNTHCYTTYKILPAFPPRNSKHSVNKSFVLLVFSTMRIEPLTTRTGTYTVVLPADKSLTHRAIIFAACAKGKSTVINPSQARDCKTTATVMQQLGVELHCQRERLEISSRGHQQLRSPSAPLDFGNSGTTACLLLGLLSSLPDMTCTCQGDASLSARPMGRIVHWLRQVGARIEGESDGERLPLTITGARLRPFSYKLKVASAQVKSALLLAAMNSSGTVEIDMPAGTRQHTEHMLQAQEIACTSHEQDGRQRLCVRGPYQIRPQTWHIAADPSAAAFFVVLGLLLPREMRIVLPDVLADDNRLAFLRVIRAMGGEVQRKNTNAGRCELVVRGGAKLQATEVSKADIPTVIDEVPILTVLATFAAGQTVWHGVGDLRTKESDRLTASANLCRAAGRDCEVRGDALVVHGRDAPITPFTFDAQDDHRLSMAAAVCASFATRPCQLENAAGVDISFPDFFARLRAVTQGG